jgi:hypothetical protein
MIIGATLTLLGLIIGFTFSMAISRYDQRKALEATEANAIGREMDRSELLPQGAAVRVASLLENYFVLRLAYYRADDDAAVLGQIAANTSKQQSALWDAMRVPALEKPTPVNALVLTGMNDVMDAESLTEAAWRNQIPTSAWWLIWANTRAARQRTARPEQEASSTHVRRPEIRAG